MAPSARRHTGTSSTSCPPKGGWPSPRGQGGVCPAADGSGLGQAHPSVGSKTRRHLPLRGRRRWRPRLGDTPAPPPPSCPPKGGWPSPRGQGGLARQRTGPAWDNAHPSVGSKTRRHLPLRGRRRWLPRLETHRHLLHLRAPLRGAGRVHEARGVLPSRTGPAWDKHTHPSARRLAATFPLGEGEDGSLGSGTRRHLLHLRAPLRGAGRVHEARGVLARQRTGPALGQAHPSVGSKTRRHLPLRGRRRWLPRLEDTPAPPPPSCPPKGGWPSPRGQGGACPASGTGPAWDEHTHPSARRLAATFPLGEGEDTPSARRHAGTSSTFVPP